MTHDISLIATIAVSLALAFGLGFLAHRPRLPPLIGYLVAGVVLGPFLSGHVADGSLAGQLAEIGIMLGGLGLDYGLLDNACFNLILAGALISITLNPLIFAGSDWLVAWVRARPQLNQRLEAGRAAALAQVQVELDAARVQAEQRAAESKTFTPEELAAMFPLFAQLTPEQREVLVLHFQPHSAEPGERIIRAGDPADALYLISKGEVEVTVDGRRINTRGPGEFFGEMALLSGDRRSADVTALDFSRFAMLSGRDFHRFLRRYPEIRADIASLAAERSRQTAGRSNKP